MPGRPELRSLIVRLGRIAAVGGPSAIRMAVIAETSSRYKRDERLAAEFARLLERLGGAFVKAGQLLGTRVDLVGETYAAALGRLHDRVEPMTGEQALGVIGSGLGHVPDGLAEALARPPVASASIACVYRADLGDRAVAFKIRRPGVSAAIAADMAILRRSAAVAARFPAFRRVPLAEIVEQVGDCLVGQLDFAAEAGNLRRLHDDLAEMPHVVVPKVLPDLCGDGVIAMEFVEGLRRSSIEALPAPAREAGIVSLVRAVYRMLFIAGFIHVDLHQGNVYFMSDGSIVILDAGFAFQMSPAARRKFTEFFGGMIQGDGDACADILLSTVRGVESQADISGFRRNVADLVVRNSGAVARDFRLSEFCIELFDLQRRYRLFAEPEFVFPMLCLLTLEGTVQRHHPAMDFQLEAAPYAMQGLLMSGDPDGGA